MVSLPNLVVKKIQWYVWENAREKGYATLHLMSLGKNLGENLLNENISETLKDFKKRKHDKGEESGYSSDDLEMILTTEKILETYPDFIKYVKRGDLIENIDESGYRSDGVYMIDFDENKKLLIRCLEYEYDDYGSPCKVFEGISQFPLDYWDYSKININKRFVNIDAEVESYWHDDDNIPVAIYPDKIGINSKAEDSDDELDWKLGVNKNIYYDWTFRGRPHMIISHFNQDVNSPKKNKLFFGFSYWSWFDDNIIKDVIKEKQIRESDIIVAFE